MIRLVEDLSRLESKQLLLLREFFQKLSQVYVAYSGGVDSTLVATIAQEQLGTNAIAVTGVSDALAPHLLEEARQQASWIGIRHIECQTLELKNPNYRKNPIDRCYSCKLELHKHLSEIAKAAKGAQVVDGVNYDDLNEHRPGIKAAVEAGVRSPLAELDICKNSVRNISKALGLPWWDKPAQPCLASRFPYGDPITSTRLQQVGKAEQWLRVNGFTEVRVRSQGLSARIEVPSSQIHSLFFNLKREDIVNYFLSIGFTSVSIDLEGLVSGKLNRTRKTNG